MASNVWKQLGSTDLSPYTITLCAWDGHPSQPHRLYCNFLVTIIGKTISIAIEVIYAPLENNIILGRSYICAVSFFSSVVHLKM